MKEYNQSSIGNYIGYLKSLESFSEQNVEAVEETLRNMKLDGAEPDTVYSFLASMKRIAPMISFPLYNCSRKNLEELALNIDNETHPDYEPEDPEKDSYAEWTHADDKASLQTFCRYFFDDDKSFMFQNIRLTPKVSEMDTVDPSELLEPREVERIINQVSHPRDRAFIALLWDSGMRRKEIAEIRWKDVIVQEDGVMQLRVRNGKNGGRTIFLYESVPLIHEWLKKYPGPESDDSLWIDKRLKRGKREVSVKAMGDAVRDAAGSASIPDRRKTNMHAFRKARATNMAANGMNQPGMERYFGWCRGSRMPRIYIQLAEVDLENQIRDIYGLERRKKQQKFIGENLKECQERKDRELLVETK